MAANLKTRAKKLYFDVILPATRSGQSFLCTQFTNGTPGDRHGRLLQVEIACTGSTPENIKARRAVCAWYQSTGITLQNATTPGVQSYNVQFSQPTANRNFVTNAVLAALPYLTVGGASVANKAGNTAIYGTAGIQRHFSVQVDMRRFGSGGTVSAHGVLYVQKQHSMEV